jgi:hypothetical protein
VGSEPLIHRWRCIPTTRMGKQPPFSRSPNISRVIWLTRISRFLQLHHSRGEMAFTTIIIYLLLLAAPALVAMTWRIALQNGQSRVALSAGTRSSLILVTLSLLLLISGYFWPVILGPYYSRVRFGLIYSNIGLTLLVAGGSAFGTKPLKLYLVASSIILAIDWAYVAVVNSTV